MGYDGGMETPMMGRVRQGSAASAAQGCTRSVKTPVSLAPEAPHDTYVPAPRGFKHVAMQAVTTAVEVLLERPLGRVANAIASHHEKRWAEGGQGKAVIGVPVTMLNAVLGRFGSAQPYCGAIRASNGIPRLMFVTRGKAEAQLGKVDGVLLAGGYDLAPAAYGQTRRAGMESSIVVPSFDNFELDVTRQALDAATPLLGICRGMQVMNVADGGTLYQDIPTEYSRDNRVSHRPKAGSYEPAHGIEIHPHSTLRALLGVERAEVNSVHHQAVDRVGSRFTVTATADDGIIEALERKDAPFQLGVQGHPERQLDTMKPLFDALIAHAAT